MKNRDKLNRNTGYSANKYPPNLDDRFYRAVSAAPFPALKLRYRNDAAAESIGLITLVRLSGYLILAGLCRLLAVLKRHWHFAIMVINLVITIPTLAMVGGSYLPNFMILPGGLWIWAPKVAVLPHFRGVATGV